MASVPWKTVRDDNRRHKYVCASLRKVKNYLFILPLFGPKRAAEVFRIIFMEAVQFLFFLGRLFLLILQLLSKSETVWEDVD